MRRLLYLAVGAGVGVAAMRRASRLARAVTPSGFAGSAGSAVAGLGGSIRGFLDDVRLGMTEREIELTEALTGEPASAKKASAPSNPTARPRGARSTS